MHPILAMAVFAAVTALIGVAVVLLARRPMAQLLRSNAWMAAGAAFYLRSFTMVVALGALATLAGVSFPCPQQSQMASMEWVWWMVQKLEPVFLIAALFLLGYALLLTILFSTLGRYRDQ
jgi:hypothetical protein